MNIVGKAFLVLSLFSFCACNNGLKVKESNEINIEKKNQEGAELKNKSEETLSFIDFWADFKEVINRKDKSELIQMVNIPFRDYYNEIYDPENTLSSFSSEEFMENFEEIFDSYALIAISQDNYRGYQKDYGEFGDVIAEDDYLLLTNNPKRGKDLLFKKIENKYRLIGIQYYQ